MVDQLVGDYKNYAVSHTNTTTTTTTVSSYIRTALKASCDEWQSLVQLPEALRGSDQARLMRATLMDLRRKFPTTTTMMTVEQLMATAESWLSSLCEERRNTHEVRTLFASFLSLRLTHNVAMRSRGNIYLLRFISLLIITITKR